MDNVLRFIYDCSKTGMVWTTGIALVNAVLLVLVPGFPTTVLGAGNAFVAAIASVWTAQEVRVQRKEKELAAVRAKLAAADLREAQAQMALPMEPTAVR